MADDTGTTATADAGTAGTDTSTADAVVAASAAATAGAEKPAGDAAVTDKPAADDKPAAGEKKAVTYDLQLPKDSTLDPAVLERTGAIARDLGLPDTPAAQRIVDFVQQEVASREAAVLADLAPGGATHTATLEAWKAQVATDPTLGTTPAERTAAIQKGHGVLLKYGEAHPEDKAALDAFLDDTGLGNHPTVARLFAWLGKAAGEQALVHGGPTGGDGKSAMQRKYEASGMNP